MSNPTASLSDRLSDLIEDARNTRETLRAEAAGLESRLLLVRAEIRACNAVISANPNNHGHGAPQRFRNFLENTPGEFRVRDVECAIEISKQRAYQLIYKLEGEGKLRKLGRGRYAVVK